MMSIVGSSQNCKYCLKSVSNGLDYHINCKNEVENYITSIELNDRIKMDLIKQFIGDGKKYLEIKEKFNYIDLDVLLFELIYEGEIYTPFPDEYMLSEL